MKIPVYAQLTTFLIIQIKNALIMEKVQNFGIIDLERRFLNDGRHLSRMWQHNEGN